MTDVTIVVQVDDKGLKRQRYVKLGAEVEFGALDAKLTPEVKTKADEVLAAVSGKPLAAVTKPETLDVP